MGIACRLTLAPKDRGATLRLLVYCRDACRIAVFPKLEVRVFFKNDAMAWIIEDDPKMRQDGAA